MKENPVVELRMNGELFVKNEDSQIGAHKIKSENGLQHLFDYIEFSEGVTLESVFKLFENYPDLLKVHPDLPRVFSEYEEIKDLPLLEDERYDELLIESHISDMLDSISHETHLYGKNKDNDALRYMVTFDDLQSFMKMKFDKGFIWTFYYDDEDELVEASPFSFFNLTLAIVLETVVKDLIVGGTKNQKAAIREAYNSELDKQEQIKSAFKIVKQDK